ncbi:MAG: mechanosensitive ion channel family protein [Elainellaceae cyanobacterium]
MKLRQLCRYAIAGLTALLLGLWCSVGVAQPEQTPEATEAPPPQFGGGVQRITPVLPPELRELIGSGSANTPDGKGLTVWFDGRRLLSVAALTDTRDNAIEQQLVSFATRRFDPNTVSVTPEPRGNLTVLVATAQPVRAASTADDPDKPAPPPFSSELMTVTIADAQLFGDDLGDFDLTSRRDVTEALAWSWAKDIQRSLVRFKLERQRQFLLQQLQVACGILVGLLVLSMSLRQAKRRLERKQSHIEGQREAIAKQLAGESDDVTLQFSLVQQDIRAQQHHRIYALKRRIVQLGELALWVGGGFVAVGLAPYTRWIQVLLLEALHIPGKLFIVAMVTYLLIRLDDILIDRLFIFIQQTPRFIIHDSQRRTLRLSTFSTVAKSITNLLVITLGIVAALWAVGVNIGPLVAGAGILGLAVSFAAQSLIRDIINGFLILLEDQYGVGDVVILGEVAGFVENMGLRITQLRNEEGRLITVPNGSITVVQNLTKEWSRVDLTVDVSYAANIDDALGVISAVAQALDDDPAWDDLILEPPTVLGVDQLSHAGATVRLWIKTLPLKQWEVAREYRRRLKNAFDKAGIDIGTPHQAIQFDGQLSSALLRSSVQSGVERSDQSENGT